ncbi:MAG: glycerol-3-phosphate 1-O-acyltransferase PlsY [Rickettsiales bacterium]|nr:glycerol-3-phosphate 1-O-acyltransferase PlsY [Rickettsiales bacterium]
MIIYLVVAFLVGGVPFGLIVGKIFGKIDIRTQGSGNIGATNVGRLLGRKYAILTFLLDGLKSFLPVLVAKYKFDADFAVCVSFFSVTGHIFSIWLKGRGGKGISSTMLALLALNYKLFLIMGISWVLCFKITKISALAALLSLVIMLISSYILVDGFSFCILLLLTAIIFFSHRSNIERMLGREELKFR